MKLVIVPVGPSPLVFACYGCNKRIDQRHEPVTADLDVPAYQAYYCRDCAAALPVDMEYHHE